MTEEEAEGLKTKHIAIISQAHGYEHCIELRGIECHEFYCYNMMGQVLGRAEITAEGSIMVIEHL